MQPRFAQLSLCKVIRRDEVYVPPRSRLYGLPPAGLGTPYVESLTSYMVRLAEAHSVTLKTLLVDEIMPSRGRAPFMEGKKGNISISGFLKTNGPAVNGTGVNAENLANSLEKLTNVKNLHSLTMNRWRNVVASRGLTRHTRAWCPLCLDEMQYGGDIVYEPLMWILQIAAVCPYHGERLHTNCPHEACQKESAPIDLKTKLGYCMHCGGWLGMREVAPNAPGDNPLLPSIALKRADYELIPTCHNKLEWDIWLSRAVGQMLAVSNSIEDIPGRGRVADAFLAFAGPIHEQRPTRSGKLTELADTLRLPRQTLYLILKRLYLPQVGTLLQMCYGFNTTPVEFLVADLSCVSPVGTKPRQLADYQVTRPERALPHLIDRSNAAKVLAEVLTREDAPSMYKVAEELGYMYSTLYYAFPELCKEVSARYKADRRAKREAHLQRNIEEVRRVTRAIYMSGRYPGVWEVGTMLSNKGKLRIPEVYRAYHETLTELNLRE
jgi:hypothetical protein